MCCAAACDNCLRALAAPAFDTLNLEPRMSTLNYGLVGCGMMGQEHIRNIQLLRDTAIAGIFTPLNQFFLTIV